MPTLKEIIKSIVETPRKRKIDHERIIFLWEQYRNNEIYRMVKPNENPNVQLWNYLFHLLLVPEVVGEGLFDIIMQTRDWMRVIVNDDVSSELKKIKKDHVRDLKALVESIQNGDFCLGFLHKIDAEKVNFIKILKMLKID
jgi:hypothetical protein